MSRILCIGNLVLDQVQLLPGYPREDSENRVLKTWRQSGGNAANTARRLAAENHLVQFLGTLADDAEADWLLQDMQAAKVNCRHCERPGGHSPVSDIWLSQANGSRTIAHRRNLPELSANALNGIPLETFDWFHLEGRNVEVIDYLIDCLRQRKFDQGISLELEKPREGLEALLPKVEVAFIASQYAQARGFFSAVDCLEELGERYPRTVMTCTWGDQGAWLRDLHGHIHHQRPGDQLRAGNTLGAGDAFNAGFIHGMNMRAPAVEALAVAVQFAETHITRAIP